ncbi:MAG TPA: LPS export ABC transporter periplasmic protein LptC [Gemmatimonadales bacterium]|nr:LPS export ABC transporter periplasmic protein LptC [Gemmatimonadales bacterium]
MRRSALRRLARSGLLGAAVLVGCNDGIKTTAIVEGAPDGSDQMLVGMEHLLTTNGVVRAKVEAETTYINSSAQVADLRQVRVTFYDAQGNRTSTLTARTGSYQLQSGDMEGRGNVVVTTTDGRRLTTEVLRYSQAKDSVSSDQPFVFEAPDRVIEGEGFTSDPAFRNVVALRPRGTGGRFVLPNQ